MGAAWVAGSQRDLPDGHPVGGAGDRGRRQLLLHLHHRSALPHGALPPQGRALLPVRGLRAGDDVVCRLPGARNQGRAHRRDGFGVEEALVLEEVHP
ncbi:hypothetical protein GW17_00047283 [Ensete ventricosum]|nr:hypothetical protein GW17_00047283 [Ensete ventricosum]